MLKDFDIIVSTGNTIQLLSLDLQTFSTWMATTWKLRRASTEYFLSVTFAELLCTANPGRQFQGPTLYDVGYFVRL